MASLLPLLLPLLLALQPLPAEQAAAPTDGHYLDIWCMMYRCSGTASSCLLDSNCRRGLFCLRKCGSQQACSVACLYKHHSDLLDAFLTCAVRDNGCVVLQPPTDEPECRHGNSWSTGLANLDEADGAWFAIRGRHEFHDCQDCRVDVVDLQSHLVTSSFRFFHYESPGRHDADSHSQVRHVRTVLSSHRDNSSLVLGLEKVGQRALEVWQFWRVPGVAGSEMLAVSYCGSAGVWRYSGELLLSRSATPAHYELPAGHPFVCEIPHGLHCQEKHDPEEL